MNRLLTVLFLASAGLLSCQKNSGSNPAAPTRTYRMGFQNSAPRPDFSLYIQSLNTWITRADAAMITTEVPWDSLLNGETAEAYVLNNYKGVTDFYRSKNCKLWVYIDPENGLDRSSDALALVASHSSIAQPAIQQIYQRFAFVMDSLLTPDHLGLALETNLIRAAAPDSIYQGIKKAANALVPEIRAFDKKVKFSISTQVDYAWGKLGGGTYLGITQDFADFPFIEELGLSSYPYFSFEKPEDIPLDYYSKLTAGRSIPVFVSEGGWTSQTITGFSGETINSSPQIQQQYITRQSQLLDNAQAIAVFQLTFTDIDLSSQPPSVPPSIKYFAYLGLVDANFNPRPALSTWDSLYKKPLKPGN
ncbi:MAG TPA: hypothetical protein VL832_22810 [Puia sp.]|nr:hypothetical protein [Puia sp.]